MAQAVKGLRGAPRGRAAAQVGTISRFPTRRRSARLRAAAAADPAQGGGLRGHDQLQQVHGLPRLEPPREWRHQGQPDPLPGSATAANCRTSRRAAGFCMQCHVPGRPTPSRWSATVPARGRPALKNRHTGIDMTDNNNRLMQRIRGARLGRAPSSLVAVGRRVLGGFNWAMEMTNAEKFCIRATRWSRTYVGEYRTPSTTRTALACARPARTATCPRMGPEDDPQDPGLERAAAQGDGHHRHAGEVRRRAPAPGAERVELHEGEQLRECRNRHNYEYFDYSVQGRRSSGRCTRPASPRARPASTATRASRTRRRRSTSTSARRAKASP